MTFEEAAELPEQTPIRTRDGQTALLIRWNEEGQEIGAMVPGEERIRWIPVTELEPIADRQALRQIDRTQTTAPTPYPALGAGRYDLYLFDIDGTLADRDSDQLYPAAVQALAHIPPGAHIALVSNQGRVGLRRWMEADGFGDPERYPTAADVERRIISIAEQVERIHGSPPDIRICYAYETRKGQWAPVPAGENKDAPEWDRYNRKPAPGMLKDARRHAGADPGRCLMIGDQETDRIAAEAAGMDYLHPAAAFAQEDTP